MYVKLIACEIAIREFSWDGRPCAQHRSAGVSPAGVSQRGRFRQESHTGTNRRDGRDGRRGDRPWLRSLQQHPRRSDREIEAARHRPRARLHHVVPRIERALRQGVRRTLGDVLLHLRLVVGQAIGTADRGGDDGLESFRARGRNSSRSLARTTPHTSWRSQTAG